MCRYRKPSFNQLLLVLCLLFSGATLRSQLQPATAVAEMGRGINLGNTLEPPLEGAWNNGPAQEAHFAAYAEAGFTNVRVPVRWDQHTATTPPYTIDEAWLDRVEEVIDWGLSRDLYITLNGHHEDWLKEDYSNPALRDRYDAIWRQIMARFGNKSEKLLLEIINEPNGMTVAEVDDLNSRILGIIRQTNPTRLVIFGGNVYANSAELMAAAVPDDPYLIGYFHSYDPWGFAGLGQGLWGSAGDYQQLDNQFLAVSNWSAANNVPVYVSEFGCVQEADYNSRMRYYAAYVETCLRYGFTFSVWDDGGMFGILNRDDNTWPEVKDILINTYADSPTDLVAALPDQPDGNNLDVLLSWTNRSSAGEIIVERRSGAAAFTELTRLPAGTTTYTDSGVSVGNFYTYRIATRRADGTLLQSYPARIFVTDGVQAPFAGTSTSIPGKLEAEDFDEGGETIAYHDTETTNIPGMYRPNEGVDIGSNERGGFSVGYVAQGEWMEYTVNVTATGLYTVAADLASEVGGGRMSVSVPSTGANVTITVPGTGTGGWTTFQPLSATNPLALEAGEQVIRLDISSVEAFNIDFLTFTPLGSESGAIINYGDDLGTAAGLFSGTPTGFTYAVNAGVLEIVGDGSATPYQNFRYTLPDNKLADVIGSDNLLYISARTRSGNTANLRIDLVDENNFHTTNASRSVDIGGTEFQDYILDFNNGYEDGGYGGTACTTGPCAVSGGRINVLTFYPEAASGGFAEAIEIDWLSFGQRLSVGVQDFAAINRIDLFPNPVADRLMVRYDLAATTSLEVELLNSLGQRVLRNHLGAQPAGVHTTELLTAALPAGTYFLRLRVDGQFTRATTVQVR